MPWSWSGSRTSRQLGDWPFEIGLWVGKAATPNVMGAQGRQRTATRRAPGRSRSRTTTASRPRFRWKTARGAARSSRRLSFRLLPNPDQPTDLRVVCQSALCLYAGQAAADPGRGRADLPAAALLPDRDGGQVRGHALDRRGGPASSAGADRHDRHGFYGPCQPRRGRPLPVAACCRRT